MLKEHCISPVILAHIEPGGSVVKNLPVMQEMQVHSLGQEGPLKKAIATHSSILAWVIPWTRRACHHQLESSLGKWAVLCLSAVYGTVYSCLQHSFPGHFWIF